MITDTTTTRPTSAAETPLENMEVLVPPTLLAQCESSCSADPAAVSAAVGAAFGKVQAFIARYQLPAVGAPRVTYRDWSADGVRFAAAIPIASVPPNAIDTGDITFQAVPGTQALRFVHHGPYHDIRTTYNRIEAFLRARGGIHTPADWAHYSPMWEEYMNDPRTTSESELITRIYLTLP